VIDLTVDGTTSATLFTLSGPDRVVVDLTSAVLDKGHLHLPAGAGLLHRIRTGPRDGGGLRFVFEVDPHTDAHREDAVAGHLRFRLSAATAPGERPAATPTVSASSAPLTAQSAPPVEAAPTPERSNSSPQIDTVPAHAVPVRAAAATGAGHGRTLIIAVDAGHGGDDPGASGPDGTHEKDITLAIARELASRINAEPGLRATLTRPDDRFVPLRERINRARRAQADLFVSVHADAVPDHSVSGASVYVLSARGATNEAAKWLADRENAADLVGGVSLDDKDNVLASVLLDLSQSAAMSASMVAAEKVLTELNTVGDVRKTRVQQAGFVVLKSPDIPSMLIETAYITNPGEEKRLRDERYQQKLAAAILNGIRNYFRESPLPGTRLADTRAEDSPSTRTR
jgi:N-acetylmuramoyl-L-alanine amidase